MVDKSRIILFIILIILIIWLFWNRTEGFTQQVNSLPNIGASCTTNQDCIGTNVACCNNTCATLVPGPVSTVSISGTLVNVPSYQCSSAAATPTSPPPGTQATVPPPSQMPPQSMTIYASPQSRIPVPYPPPLISGPGGIIL
jgi:hypothetical protein